MTKQGKVKAWRVLLETHDHRVKTAFWFGLCHSVEAAKDARRLTKTQAAYLHREIRRELNYAGKGPMSFLLDMGGSDVAGDLMVICRLMWCELMALAAQDGAI